RDFHVTGVQTCALPICMLIGWSQCMSAEGSLTLPCDNSSTTPVARYGIWMYDPVNGIRQPVITGEAGTLYTDMALAFPYQNGNQIGRASCREREEMPVG